MKEVKTSKGEVALVSDCDFEAVSQHKWRYKTVYLHHFIVGRPAKGMLVDHIDRNTLNNQRENLRMATHSQSGANRSSSVGSSCYRGVFLDTSRKTKNVWRASIVKDRKRTYLGRFPDEISAALAYDKAALEMFGEYACINF
jgi:hypothetical protein